MPLIAVESNPDLIRGVTGRELPEPKPAPDHADVIGAAFLMENPVVNLFRGMARGTFPAEEGHNPVDVIVRESKYFERYPEAFYGSSSTAETQARMRRIDEEEKAREVLEASGFAGVVAQMGAGMLDPTLALPGGAIVKGTRGGYSVLKTAAMTGTAAGAQVAFQEAILQGAQETRTGAESAFAIGTGTLLGALLGGGAAALLSRGERTALEGALDQTRREMQVHAGVPEAAGAAATDTRQLDLKSSGLGWTAPVSPTRRVLSTDSLSAKRTMADLAETPYRFEENEAGVATMQGPALSRLAQMEIMGARVEVADEIDRLWGEARFGDEGAPWAAKLRDSMNMLGREDGKPTHRQFREMVGDAMRNGDQHEIPQVAAAAQYVRRRVFEPWKKRAIEAGMLPEGVDVKTADSYFQRVYNKEIINARRPEFADRVTDWLESDQATKAAAKERLTALADELNAAETAVAKANSEDGAVTATTRRDAVRAKIEEEIGRWEGKSAAEAKSAIRAREKYAADRADPDAPRLTQADSAIDRAVKRIIESDRALTRDELRGRAQEITDRIIGSPDGRLPYDIHTGGPEIGWKGPGASEVRGPLQARDFMIPDAAIKDFLINDVEEVVGIHLRTIVPDVLLTEKFGDVRMTEPMKKITEDYAAKIDAVKSEKERTRLGKERDAVIRDIAAVRDRVRGVYGWDPNLRNMARVASGAKIVNNLTSMGMAAISSLPDMAGVVFRHGFGTAFADGWAPMFKYLSGNLPEFEKFKGQMRALGIATDTTINARQNAIDDITDLYRPQSRFERGMQAVNDKFFIANLLSPLTDFQKSIAAHVSVSEIIRAAKAASEGKATQRQIANLAESGIDRQMAERIWRQFETGGEVTNGVHLPNTADWTDQAAARALNGAVAREVDIAVVTPGQEKPLWMSRPVAGVLGQFKSFTASATERILIANLQRRDAAVLSGLIFAVSLGMLSYKVNSMLGGQAVSDRPQDWFKEGISRSGLLGWFEEGNALASKFTRGSVDVYRMIGANKPLSRFASRSTLDMLLGPTAGKITGLAQVTGAGASLDWGESDTKALRRLVAFQNLFYVRGLLNQVEAGVNGAFGIEMKAR